eukprot:TRINITY_DN25407_c0_g1_i1.p1 TRINITY_DN25407_c0_g1~~TRINITY_DN25407_c0_g1_i1.p1  ORF type:complete len:105 (+),score=22.22 TRINITY_DN25407_c0_g1_i1:66-380(+)
MCIRDSNQARQENAVRSFKYRGTYDKKRIEIQIKLYKSQMDECIRCLRRNVPIVEDQTYAICQRCKPFVDEEKLKLTLIQHSICLLYTSPSPRDRQKSRMPSSA